MGSINRKRAERIRSEISILKVLYDYGYKINPEDFVPQQFFCDLHGTGFESRASSRVYPENNNWYCWGCGKARDAIETVREKEHTSFNGACQILERRYGLPEIDWGSDGEFLEETKDYFSMEKTPDFSDYKERCNTLLLLETKDRELPMKILLSLWEVFDQIVFLVEKERISKEQGIASFEKIKQKITSLRQRLQ